MKIEKFLIILLNKHNRIPKCFIKSLIDENFQIFQIVFAGKRGKLCQIGFGQIFFNFQAVDELFLIDLFTQTKLLLVF